jgi:polyribonucleotide 5'-hydroxyl-kinase
MSTNPTVNEYRLDADSELRIEIGREEVVIELLSGDAEIFGTPLSLHKRYNLPPGKLSKKAIISKCPFIGYRAAISTYHGAQIEVVGTTESAYIAQQTPMVITHETYRNV